MSKSSLGPARPEARKFWKRKARSSKKLGPILPYSSYNEVTFESPQGQKITACFDMERMSADALFYQIEPNF